MNCDQASVVPNTWKDVPSIVVPLGGEPLDLRATLDCGQAFRWSMARDGLNPQEHDPREIWEGVAFRRVWRIRRKGDDLIAQSVPVTAPNEVRGLIRHYFSLDVPLRRIQGDLAARHPRAAEAIRWFPGLRILRQDPRETLLSFSIASATNVKRIRRSIAALCATCGDPIAHVDGVEYRAFPRTEMLLAASDGHLAGSCGMAYRSVHLQSIAGALADRSPGWLEQLASLPYQSAHAALDELRFCGPKIADCQCLFGLGFGEAVPVDVHVWAIARELFGPVIRTRTLTPKTYHQIGRLFRDLFGDYAGWAQQYLYAARRATPVVPDHAS